MSIFKILLFVAGTVVFTSCASMISGVSLSSLLSGKSVRLCPEERKAIIDEAVDRAVETIKKDQEKNRFRRYFDGF